MTSVLVTGATGFIGSAYARAALARGDEVFLLARSSSAGSEVLRELISDGGRALVFDDSHEAADQVIKARPDRIVHLATHYVRTDDANEIGRLIQANVEFGTQVLEGAAVSKADVLVASSFLQFRDSRPAPSTLYAASKQALNTIAEYYRAERGLRIAEVVLYDSYGPRDRRDKLIPNLLASMHSGASVHLGAPDQPILLVHVDDVVAGLDASFQSERTTAIRPSTPVTVGEIARTLDELSAGRVAFEFRQGATPNPRPLVAGDWPNPPGWEPRVPLRQGLQALVRDEMTSTRSRLGE